MSTFATVVVLAALIFGLTECQQCREFICPGQRCLNQSTICNAVNDCVNGSGLSFSSFDEDRCTAQGMFNCTNGVEVNTTMLCNTIDDCGDNSDEEYELCPTSPAPRNNDDDGYDLVIPRLILFVVIPVAIVLILMVAIPVLSLWVWRLCKLRRMKDRLTIAETVRTGDDTLEHGRLTRGTFHNTHADTSFSVANQTLPQSQQTSPALQTSPYVPRFPAPPPPTSYQQQQPPPPPPPELQSDALESTSEVAVDVQLPSNMPPARFLGDRTSTISGAFDVLAVVTAAEDKKRHSTVSGDGPSSITRSNSSAFRRWERPTTPPPPPPPPTNGAPAIPPKPNSPTRHLMGQQPPAATWEEDETDEPLYEPIPGDQPEAVTGHQVTAGGDDDDTYVIDNIQQSPSTSDQDDTYDIPVPYSNSPPYEIMTSSNSAPPPRPPKPNKSQNPLDQLVQEEDPVNQEAEFDREVSNSSQIDDTYEVLDLNDND